jgi:hypothetical protein
VQVLVLGFDEPAFNGEILAELTRLREAGVVQLLDVLLVSRVDEDTFETLTVPGGMPTELGRLTAALLGRPDNAGHAEADVGDPEVARESLWSLADSVPVGSVAAVALIEHVWATPLRDAIQRAGGAPLDETWLAPRDVQVLEALMDPAERT